MAKRNKVPAPTPEALNFVDLICKIGNETVSTMRKDITGAKLPAGKKKASKVKNA
jgi:hypothetical protein